MITCETATSSSSGAMHLPATSSSRSSGGDSPAGGCSNNGTGTTSTGTGGCTELIAVSATRNNHGSTAAQQEDPSGPSDFVVHRPLPSPGTHIINLPQAYVPESADPLSFFLASGRSDRDPFGFGVGSVADGTFGGLQPTSEQLLLFRSHRLLQAEAVSVAIGKAHSSSASVRQRFSLVSTTLARRVRLKVLEQTNSAVERVRGLGGSASASQQQDIINVERRACHHMLASILDSATDSLREISDGSSSGSIGGAAGVDGAATDSGFDGEIGHRQGFPSSMLESSPTESHQLAFSWEDAATPSRVNGSHAANPIQQMPPTGQQQQHQQQSILHMQAGMGRSSVFAHTQMRDRSHHHATFGGAVGGFPSGLNPAGDRQPGGGAQGFGAFPGSHHLGGGMHTGGGGGSFNAGGSAVPGVPSLSLNHGGLSAPTPFDAWSVAGGEVGRGGGGGGNQALSSTTKKRSALLTKIGAHPPDFPRAANSNRKGSRHRLTPQAKEILEGWLAGHWLNPYPTEDEKGYLAQACHITVTQVNNWMMNVRVRRCRTKKIGVATGPEQITYPAIPKAIAVNRAKASPSLELQLAPTGINKSAAFRGAMVLHQERGAGARHTGSGVAIERLGDGGPGLPPLRGGQTGQLLLESSSQLRIDQTTGNSPRISHPSPGSDSSGPSGAISGVPATPWPMQQEPQPGGHMGPAESMSV